MGTGSNITLYQHLFEISFGSGLSILRILLNKLVGVFFASFGLLNSVMDIKKKSDGTLSKMDQPTSNLDKGSWSGTTVYIYESEAQSKEERKQQPKRNNYMNYNITTSARLNCYPLLSDFDTTYNFNCLYKAPPRIPDVLIPQGEILQLVSALIYDINHALAPIRHIATRKDLKKFLSVIAGCVFSQFEQLLQLLNLVLLKLPIASHITSDVREKQRSGGCIWREGDAGVQPALHSVRGESFKQYLIGSVQRQEKSLKDRLYQLSTLAQILL